MSEKDPCPGSPADANARNAERSASRSEHSLRALVEHCPDIIARFDRALRLTYVNPAVERSLGTPAAGLVGKTVEEAGLGPEAYSRWLEAARTVLDTGAERDLELPVSGPKGRILYEVRLAPEFEPDGRVGAIIALARDITRRALVELELKDSEQRFRMVLANSPVTVLTCDRDLRYTWIYNPFPLFRTDSVPCKRDDELAPEPDVRELVALKRRVLETGSGRRGEITVRVKGEERWYDAVAEPIRDDAGNITGVRAAVMDITERRRAEQRLRESEERNRILAEAAPHMTWMMRPGRRVEFVNRRWTEYTGLSLAETVRVGFLSLIHPDDLGRVTEVIVSAEIHDVANEIEFRLRRRDGSYGWVLAWSVPVKDAGGAVVQWIGTLADIDRRKRVEAERERLLSESRRQCETAERLKAQAEKREREAQMLSQRFRRLLEGGIIGIAVADESGIVDANEAFLKLLGYSRADLESHTINWHVITPPECRGLEQWGQAQLREKGRFGPVEKEFIRKDGSRVPVLIGAAVLRPPPDLEWVKFVLDLTDRKQAEEQLRRAQRMESIGILAGGIAHDFNNLMTGVLGNASLVLDLLQPGDPTRRYIETIIRQSEKAAELTRQLLAYAGKGRFVLVPLDVSAAASGVLRVLRGSLPARIEIQEDLDPGLPMVDADPGQIDQVVTNLVRNAAEAIGGGTGRILVRTACHDIDDIYLKQAKLAIPPGAYVCLEVHDTGHGIEPGNLERIFEPFFTTRFAGRGLGLAAVHGIIEGHRGSIQVFSQPGKGSRFVVLLPVSERARHEAPRQERERALEGHETVLVVDDEEAVLSVADEALRRYGYRVLTARHGAEAVDVFRNSTQEIAGVVLDLTMPGMPAEEVLSRLKAIRPNVPVLMSSRHSEAEVMRRLSGREIAGFLAKPYTASALAAKVRSALGRKTRGAA